MKLHFVRSEHEGIIGITLLFGNRVFVAAKSALHPTRICESCLIWPAMVFCRTHAEYFCCDCLPLHTEEACTFYSMAAIADLVKESA